MLLRLFHDDPSSEPYADVFAREHTLDRLKALDSRVRRKGLTALDPSRNGLIRIGMEVDAAGRVARNGYGVLSSSWQAKQHREWARAVLDELDAIREEIRERHKTPLRFLVWAGMGGSAEDKLMYNAAGLLSRGPRCYVLDSTDPSKLKLILDDMLRRSRLPLAAVLKSTLVVGTATEATSCETVVNLEKLAALYARERVDNRPNFICMALAGSLLDEAARRRGWRRADLQLDGANTTAGRHSAPLTRGSLYPLGLAGVDVAGWIGATCLTEQQILAAWRLAAFLHAQGLAGRDKATLLLAPPWSGAALWTKQAFEESLGKSEELGVKIVIEERPRLGDCRPPKDPAQDRVFLAVQLQGAPVGVAEKAALIRRAGYPVAALTFQRGATLARYLQFMHYVVFGLARLRGMNFVTEPSVELYKAIANRLHTEAQTAGGIEKTREWQKMLLSPRQSRWCDGLTLRYDRLALPADVRPEGLDAPALYAALLRSLAQRRLVEYAELTFFGDMRYSERGRSLRRALNRAAERLFRSRLKMPVDIHEGPAMNHSYHEMIIGHGRCFSTLLATQKAERFPAADYTADHHRAQFLATQMALAERRRPVVSLMPKDLEEHSLKALEGFFQCAAAHLK